MTHRRSRSPALLLAGTVLALPLSLSPIMVAPASAQWVVYDPTNYAQNVLQAARALQQVNNQITSLQNEAQSLINQARNLASLPHSSLQQIQQSVQRTQALLTEAQNIAFDVQQRSEAHTSELKSLMRYSYLPTCSLRDALPVWRHRRSWSATTRRIMRIICSRRLARCIRSTIRSPRYRTRRSR